MNAGFHIDEREDSFYTAFKFIVHLRGRVRFPTGGKAREPHG